MQQALQIGNYYRRKDALKEIREKLQALVRAAPSTTPNSSSDRSLLRQLSRLSKLRLFRLCQLAPTTVRLVRSMPPGQLASEATAGSCYTSRADRLPNRDNPSDASSAPSLDGHDTSYSTYQPRAPTEARGSSRLFRHCRYNYATTLPLYQGRASTQSVFPMQQNQRHRTWDF